MKMKVGVCDRDPDNITPLLKKKSKSFKIYFFVTLAYLRAQFFFKNNETSEPIIYLIMIDICKLCFQVMEHMIRGACGLPVVNDAGVVSRVGQGRVLLPQCPAMDQHLRKEDAIRPPAHNV